MRILALLLFAAAVSGAAPLDVQFSVLGPWGMCPGAIFCTPDPQPAYIILAKASGLEVSGFTYTLRYMQGGTLKEISGSFPRDDADTGYSNSQVITIGVIERLISIDVLET